MNQMQKVLGYVRKAIQQYDMIHDGDNVAVGVSGGKDSLVLLEALVRLRRFAGIDYTVTAISIDPLFDNEEIDFCAVEEMCLRLNVPYIIKRTNIAEVVFNIRKESNPCSLCAKMRRGALHEAAKSAGCNYLALGHNFNDAVETFIMNLFNTAHIGCFAPKSYLTRRDLYVIRPLCFVHEADVMKAAVAANLPIIESKCPVDGRTSRETTKQFILSMDKQNPGFSEKIFRAMCRANINGWGADTALAEDKELSLNCQISSPPIG